MTFHFFPRFDRNAADSPLGDALRSLAIPHSIFATSVSLTYKYRLQLLLIGYPRLACSAFVVAMKSMFGWRFDRGAKPPTVSIISSDVEVLMFAIVRALPFAAKPRFVLMPFIFTQRRSEFINRVRLFYYRFVMRRVSCAICHSSLETKRYEEMFAGCGTHFVFVPWGTYVPTPKEISADLVPLRPEKEVPRIVTAGRSGRDYPTLVAAVSNLRCKLTIICNEQSALGGIAPSEQVEILTNIFGAEYLVHLLRADLVVVPLQVDDISAGQMVLIQAMAYARPLVVTDTPTVGDYLVNDETALLVPRGNIVAMEAAIKRVLDDPAAAAAMGERAKARYVSHFSIEQHVHALVHAVTQTLRSR